MTRTNDNKIEIRLPTALKELVRRKATGEGREVSDVIREMLTEWVARDTGKTNRRSPGARKAP